MELKRKTPLQLQALENFYSGGRFSFSRVVFVALFIISTVCRLVHPFCFAVPVGMR